MDESNSAILFIEKPKPTDAFSIKERYIQSKVSSNFVLPFILKAKPSEAFSIINIWPVRHLLMKFPKGNHSVFMSIILVRILF